MYPEMQQSAYRLLGQVGIRRAKHNMSFFASLRCNMSSQSHGRAPMPECGIPRGPTFLMYRIPRLSGPLIHFHPQSANSVARGILPLLKKGVNRRRDLAAGRQLSRKISGRERKRREEKESRKPGVW